jgi:hypothetical protein
VPFLNNVQSNICGHLEVLIPSFAILYLVFSFTRRWFDNILPELPKCIKDLVEIAGHGRYGSPKCVVHKCEPLVMANSMKKHSNLLFHTSADDILQQSSLIKPLNYIIEGALLNLSI